RLASGDKNTRARPFAGEAEAACGAAGAAWGAGAAAGVGAGAAAGAGEAGFGVASAFAGAASVAGFAAPAEAPADFTSSPSPASTAMTSLTGSSYVPSGTRIFALVPSSTASTSMVALSVSISAITSPDLTLSPSFLSHLARLPFSIVGDSAGIRMLMGILTSQDIIARCLPTAGRPTKEC